ncbi:MAG: ABC transporter substrate-binding protein [Deltaproteobacteria bacterium]|nr:ABC transporter substrate-binding protein [Deltaproteobacteria bacterium]
MGLARGPSRRRTEFRLPGLITATIVLALLLPAPPEGLAQTKPRTRLQVPYSTIGAASTPTWLAKDAGLFERHGLDVTLVYLAGATKAIAAMLSGEAPIVQSAGTGTILARLNGSDVVHVAHYIDRLIQALYVDPAIRGPAELKGKVIGITRFGALTDFGVRYLLRTWNLVPIQDVGIQQMGGFAEIVAGMQGGALHGGIASPPFTTRMKKLGYRELANLARLDFRFPSTVISVPGFYLRSQEDVVRRFLRAYVEAIAQVKTNEELAIRVISRWTRERDHEILTESYRFFRDIYEAAPYPTVEGVRNVLEWEGERNPRAKQARPEEFIAPRYVKELDDSGFIRQLYPRPDKGERR